MKNSEYQCITKMIDYINRAEAYTNNITFEEFSENTMIIDASVFAISQIGELVKNLDKEFQNKYCNIKWHILKSLQNRIVHDYDGINLELIWTIIKRDIIKLRYDLKEIIKENN